MDRDWQQASPANLTMEVTVSDDFMGRMTLIANQTEVLYEFDLFDLKCCMNLT